MSILVTGATGFIGSRLTAGLADAGFSLRVLCRASANVSHLVHPNITIVRGDITNPEHVDSAVDGCGQVFHLAAYARTWARNPETFTHVNVGGLRNILNSARKENIRVVWTSTQLTLSPSAATPVDETDVRTVPPFTGYEHSKMLAERIAREYVESGSDVVTIQPTRVFGPGLMNEGNSVTKMIRMYLDGTYRTLVGNGSAIGNWAYVEDVVQGHLNAMTLGGSGERYILGGENASFNEFFNTLKEVSGVERYLVNTPAFVAMAIAHIEVLRGRWTSHQPLISPGWVRIFLRDWAVSNAKAEAEIGYTVTPLREAVRSTVDWLRTTHYAR